MSHPLAAPEPAVVAAIEHLRQVAPDALGGPALEVASGAGRHALWLGRLAIPTHAIDRDPAAIASLDAAAHREGLPVTGQVLDLETSPPPDLGGGNYRLVVVVNYLHRPLFPQLIRALAPGGALVVSTFTIDQPRFGRPHNPRFLLEHGELPSQLRDLDVIFAWEGIVDGTSARATAIGQKPAQGKPGRAPFGLGGCR